MELNYVYVATLIRIIKRTKHLNKLSLLGVTFLQSQNSLNVGTDLRLSLVLLSADISGLLSHLASLQNGGEAALDGGLQGGDLATLGELHGSTTKGFADNRHVAKCTKIGSAFAAGFAAALTAVLLLASEPKTTLRITVRLYLTIYIFQTLINTMTMTKSISKVYFTFICVLNHIFTVKPHISVNNIIIE